MSCETSAAAARAKSPLSCGHPDHPPPFGTHRIGKRLAGLKIARRDVEKALMLLDETPGLLILAGWNADRAGASADRAIERIARTVPRAIVTVTVTTGLAALAVVFVQRSWTQVPKGREAGLGFVPGPFQCIDVGHDRLSGLDRDPEAGRRPDWDHNHTRSNEKIGSMQFARTNHHKSFVHPCFQARLTRQ